MPQFDPVIHVRAMTPLEVYKWLTNHTTVQARPAELIKKGWQPFFDLGLVGISTTGYLAWIGSSGGRAGVDETNSSSISNVVELQRRLLSCPNAIISSTDQIESTLAQARAGRARIGYTSITTDGAGAAADQILVAALAGYYGVVRIKGIIASGAAAACLLHFETGTPTALAQLPGGEATVALVANTVNTQLEGVVLYLINADNLSIRVDVSAGGAANTIIIFFEYWYET